MKLKNLQKNTKEILKVEVGTLLFNLGKTHAGIGNWRKYFDIDEEQFKKKYGYKPFSGYRDYFKTNNKESNFNSKSPFTIDMDSINKELKNFFYETDINFSIQISRKNIKQINLKLIDVVRGNAGDSEFINKVMFRGCENINSGIDKGAPKKQLNNLYIANAFGAEKEEITNSEKDFADLTRYDSLRIKFFKNLWEKIESMGRVNIDVSKMRNFIFEEVEKWYSHLLSDSRFPINDVTLWDQVYMTVSMFKASIAAMCLDGKKYQDYITNPRSIRWSILGVQYDKLGLAEKALKLSFIDWYRDKTDMVDKAVKEVIEEDYALGNEVYRDETGIYFIVPENICGEKTDSDRLYRIHDDLSEIQEKIIKCFKLLNGEAFPSIYVTEPSRGIMNIAYLLDKAKENFLKPVFPKGIDLIKEYFKEIEEDHKFKVICDICKVRLADNEKNEDLNLCSICRERKKETERPKLKEEYKETIWTGELQDKNGRIVLITMKFELDEWLNGNMLNTMLIADYDMEQVLNELKDNLSKDIDAIKKNRNGIKVKNSVLSNILYSGNLPPETTLTKYAEFILLERSIGDRWEKLLKDNLNDKIDFEQKEIKWKKLNEKQIKFLSKILLQFVTRKNPSPARFRRIWETTKEFFIDIENNMMDILEIPKWRNVRIKWNKTIKEDKLKQREFEYKGLNFMSDEDSLYLISSIEKAIPILRKEKVEIDKAYDEILSGKAKWMKNRIKIGGEELKLNNPKYISYKPYISIIEPTPISWQFIIPAEYVPKLIEKVQHKYDEEFKYVKGKLPLHIGVVFQNYKKPLYIGIKALRNIRRDIEGWDCIKKEISGKELKQILDKAINNSSSGCEDRTELKRYYSLYPLAGSGKGDYNFYINPDEEPVKIKSAATAKDSEKYSVYPNTVDFEYLDVNTRRNDIYYEGSSRSKYIAEYKRNRPYDWEEWESFYEFYGYFKDKERKTKLQTIISLIYSKLNDWEYGYSLKHFMLSAFINTFKLYDDESKNEFVKIFGLSAWPEIESLNHMEFKEKICKVLDMYDFWHNGLKEI